MRLNNQTFKQIMPLMIIWLALFLQTGYLLELRADFPHSFEREPFCGVDAKVYVKRAWGLLDGSIPGQDTYYFIPLYPIFLANLWKFWGDSLLLPVFMQFLLQSLGLAALYRIGRLTFSALTGTLAALGLATYNYYLFYLPCFDQVVLTVPALLLAVLGLLKYHRRRRSRWLLLAGLALGLTALSRPTVMAVFPGIILWLYLIRRDDQEAGLRSRSARPTPDRPRSEAGPGTTRLWGRLARDVIFLSLPCILVISPITWHNYRVSGRLVLLSDNFGVNIFTGNNPEATGLDSLAHSQSQPAALRFIETRSRVEAGQTTLTAEVLRYIVEQPGDWLALTATKTWLWLGEVDERLVTPYFPLTISQLPGVYRAWVLTWLPLEWRAMAVVALLGILLVPLEGRARRRIYLLWLVYGLFSLASILFFIQLRFRLPVVPFVLLSAASLLVAAPRLSRRYPARYWTALIVLLLLYPIVPGLWLFILILAGSGLWPAVSPLRPLSSRLPASPPSRLPASSPPLLSASSPPRLPASLPPPLSASSPLRLLASSPLRLLCLAAICLYLLGGDLWLRAEALASDVSQTIDHYLGPPLAGSSILGQTFRMDCNGLNRLEITLGLFNGIHHNQPVIFSLATDPSAQKILFSETFEGSQVTDYQRRSFSFAPIRNSAGRTFFFFIASPTSTRQNAITARGYTDTPVDRYPAGNAWAGQPGSLQRLQADFAFGAYCELSLAQKLGAVWDELVSSQ